MPRGLTPRVNRVSYTTHPTVLVSTVATWIKDLNPKQLRAVARNAIPLKTRVLDVVRRVLSGRGGATDPHGRTGRSGVNSNQPISGRSREIKFACDGTARFGTCGQNGEASGLVPEVLHSLLVEALLNAGVEGRLSIRSYRLRNSSMWSIRFCTRSDLPMSCRTRSPSVPVRSKASSTIASAAGIESATPTTANDREVVV